jgi:hypothetical protein
MARVKKSRKIGQIGAPKESWAPKKRKESQAGKPKSHKGNPSGTRNSELTTSGPQNGQRQSTDPRIGSKKPIPLVVETKADKPKPAKPKYFSPAEELQAIEDDSRLDTLLDQLDQDKKINRDDKAYMDSTLARHKVLCELLGVGDAEQKDPDQDDPFERFESIDINKLN